MLQAGRLLTMDQLAAARAGDCVSGKRWVYCLPAVVNIGAQKAGTGELQTWLSKHPAMLVHGGEVHFFDHLHDAQCDAGETRDELKLRYLRYLWRGRQLTSDAVTAGPAMLPPSQGVLDESAGRERRRGRGARFRQSGHDLSRSQLPVVTKVAFEKTPAYLDVADPALLACIAPEMRLLLMLREPSARMVSAYQMCQYDRMGKWCRPSIDSAVAFALRNETWPPRLDQHALEARPVLRRVLTLGLYSAHLSRWLVHFPASAVRVQWVEHFKEDPFRAMAAVESYLGLPHHDYKTEATKNDAGLWVVGKSKSTNRQSRDRPTRATVVLLNSYYAPWQTNLQTLLSTHSIALLPNLPMPGELEVPAL